MHRVLRQRNFLGECTLGMLQSFGVFRFIERSGRVFFCFTKDFLGQLQSFLLGFTDFLRPDREQLHFVVDIFLLFHHRVALRMRQGALFGMVALS